MKFIVVIPARYKSSRLPGKPLIDICGKTMIERTYERCNKVVGAESIIVATDDKRIADICSSKNIKYMMTPSSCLTGTDRVANIAKKTNAEIYINVQGDEPLFNPLDLKNLIKKSKEEPSNIICGYTQITEKSLFYNSQIPKVVFDENENLLYMSRSPVPGNKEESFTTSYRQVCAYAFPKKDLLLFSSVRKKTPLESIEDLELLRFLELGKKIKMLEMTDSSISVDNPEDVEKVIRLLKK